MNKNVKFIIGLISVIGIAGYFYYRKNKNKDKTTTAKEKVGVDESPLMNPPDKRISDPVGVEVSLIPEQDSQEEQTDDDSTDDAATGSAPAEQTSKTEVTIPNAETDMITSAYNGADNVKKEEPKNQARRLPFTGTSDRIGGFTYIKKITGKVYEI